MEYVANAQGQTVLTAPVAAASAVQPAPIGGNAATVVASSVVPPVAASPSPSALTLAQAQKFIKDVLASGELEVSKVLADKASVQKFAESFVASTATDVADVKSMPKALKIAFAVSLVLAYAAGFATKLFL